MPTSPPPPPSPWDAAASALTVARPAARVEAGTVNVPDYAVLAAVRWGLYDDTSAPQVVAMLELCYPRLTQSTFQKVMDAIAQMQSAREGRDTVWKAWERVLGKMVRLDMERSK